MSEDAGHGRMPRLYHDGPLSPGATVELPERAARHVQVLRLRVNDKVILFNGDGSEWDATLAQIGKRSVVATIGRRSAVNRETPLDVHLLQGVCAADRMDLVLQKATELGVASIQPVITARSIVRLSEERQARRHQHWQNVVIAACEQCGRNTIPVVAPGLGFAEVLAALPAAGERILLSPDGEHNLRGLPPPAHVRLLIGPEGGLTPEERAMAVAAGFVPVRFGPRILRTETAPLAALAAIQALWGDC
ncbi:MAG: 16S rRNA (uracil(1498)-N(3))-methyltransferase [Pseudomonadota bacterium]